jgi:hypothetical protein
MTDVSEETLKIEAKTVGSSETLGTSYKTAGVLSHNPEQHNPNFHSSENIKSHMIHFQLSTLLSFVLILILVEQS